MRIPLPVILAVAFLSPSIAATRDKLCSPAEAFGINRSAGVIVQKVTLSGKWGTNSATLFLPDKEIAEAAVLLSHSAIHTDTGASVDLLPFALTLARAGAAVLVPDRILNWPPSTAVANREGAAVTCAAQWIVENVKVALRETYGYVGPRVCDPDIAGHCRLSIPFGTTAVPSPAVWVPLGETAGGDNTNGMLSTGGLHSAQWLQQMLGLAPIQSIVAVS